jgi:hypothetical protein
MLLTGRYPETSNLYSLPPSRPSMNTGSKSVVLLGSPKPDIFLNVNYAIISYTAIYTFGIIRLVNFT